PCKRTSSGCVRFVAMGHKPPFDHLVTVGELLGQPRFPKALNEQLRVCLSAPGDKRRYCKGGIDLKHTRRRVVCLSVTLEMGEGGREAAISCHIELLTKGFLPYADRLVKATKLNKGHPNASKRHV